MTLTTMAMLATALAAAGSAQANRNPSGEAQTIRGCVRTHSGGLNSTDLTRAKHISKQIIASAGVSLQWSECRQSESTEQADVVIDIVTDAPNNFHPGALAYALPFEGTHIVVMADRLLSNGAKVLPVLLGHVMSHEIAHLLQNSQMHSAKGIMKAHWTSSDFAEMLWRPMRFSAEDTEWIRTGMRLRRQTAIPPTTVEAR
jgi:hypothetical protein